MLGERALLEIDNGLKVCLWYWRTVAVEEIDEMKLEVGVGKMV